MKIKLHLDENCYTSKPCGKEIPRISKRITDKVTEIEIEEFAKEVGERGRTFTPAIFNGERKTDKYICQQAHALDFDGGFTVKQFMNRADKYDVLPAVIYETFSSTEEAPRFRAIFINDCAIYDLEAALILTKMLQEIFPEADRQCKDASRMFYGGKQLILCKKDAVINLLEVSLSLQAYLKDKDSKNYSRKIKQIGKSLGVALESNNMLCIHRMHGDEKFEEFCGMTSIIMVKTQKSSNFYIIEKSKKDKNDKLHRESICQNKNIRKGIRGVSSKLLEEKCRLFSDFYKTDIDHNHKFLLATSMLALSNGAELFFGGVIEHRSKWEQAWKYIKYHQYLPQRCERGGCPYYEECKGRTVLGKVAGKIQKIKKENYIDIVEAERLLEEAMSAAVEEKRRGIYLILAQTALGKTYTYCRIVKNNLEKKAFMIVVPTVKLQEEVGEELRRLDVPVFLTPNADSLLEKIHVDELRETVENLYEKGYGFAVKGEILKYMKENKQNLYEWQNNQLKDFLNFKEKLDGKGCVVTTHAMFLSLPPEITRNYEIIVDEDLMMTIFKNTSSISFEDIKTALEDKVIPAEYYDLIQKLDDMEDGETINVVPKELRREQLYRIYEKNPPVNSALTNFLTANTYYKDADNEQINYFLARDIPDVKMTIVSATLNEELYRNYCKGRYIYKREVPLVKYKGNLEQYTAHSMSRSNMEEVGLKRIKKGISKITERSECKVITFKKYAENSKIYYGKTEGYNEYKGKNLVVIGTPHNVPFVYRLIGGYLGYKADDTLSVRFVENDSYSFPFMTFKDDKMRNLQFYFIESEIEQAIGRARLLRYDCNVYLFSNYPCKQADIIQDEYLPDIED